MIDQYRNWLLARQYSEKSIHVYLIRVQKFLDHYPDPTFKKSEAIDYLSHLRKSGMKPTTLEGHFAALKNFFIFASFIKEAPFELHENPLKHLLPIKREKRVPKVIPNDSLSALLRAPDLKTLRGCRDYVIMLFLLHGLRAEEICNLNIDDVYMDGYGASRRLVIDVKGKGRKERRIVVEKSGDTQWAWDHYSAKRDGITNIAFPAILGNDRYKRLTTNGLYRILERYSKKLGVKGSHPHVWRHTAAVHMLENGVSLKEVQLRLGHESVKTTEIYTAAAAILQEDGANSEWIHKLKKADARHRRWRLK